MQSGQLPCPYQLQTQPLPVVLPLLELEELLLDEDEPLEEELEEELLELLVVLPEPPQFPLKQS